ncbi:MAG: phospholipid carrier-dependent glycosyltransferase [Lachnospiraceae bacterium]|nr:phospholipid carrier-dependent glycosyltransferase [Lachnospiraceae bacterium]
MAINYRLRYLGIVAKDDEAVINEIVFIRADGTPIQPVNADDYPTLFDEQELLPSANTYLTGSMFDETFQARTAYEYLNGLPAYEIVHPPLGKILISLGISLFGMHPFGWRFMSVLFGICIIPLIYLFAKRSFKNTFIAAATSALLTFDCMHFTLSRIATIDIFAAFFILLMYYFMYRYFAEDSLYRASASSHKDVFPPPKVYLPLALSGISMALGIATKWTGVFAGIGLAILFIWYTISHYPGKQTLRLFFFCCLFFILIPGAVYVLSFIPVVGFTHSGLIDKVIQASQYIFTYHSTLVDEHYYSSRFYEWAFIWMQLLCTSSMEGIGKMSSISTMGNPAIWWTGIFCQLYVLFRWILKKDKKAGFLCISYLAQYIPWMFVSRTTYIYHYFPASLFMILMIGYTMLHIKEHFPYGKKMITIYMAIVVLCFFLFFPLVSGFPVSREYGLSLRWLKDWILVV